MSLTKNIDDADSPTSSEQTGDPERNFFGIAGTLGAWLVLWPLGLGAPTVGNFSDLSGGGWRRGWNRAEMGQWDLGGKEG